MKTAKCLILKIVRSHGDDGYLEDEVVVIVNHEDVEKIKSHVEYADRFKDHEDINIEFRILHSYIYPRPNDSDWWFLALNISPNEGLSVVGEFRKDGIMVKIETEKFDLSDFDTVLGL